MNYIKNDYLDFVPNLLIGETNECILVCCHLKNGKIYKKSFPIGFIYFHKKIKKYHFCPLEQNSFCQKTLDFISQFIYGLDNGRMIFNPKKGEIKEC